MTDDAQVSKLEKQVSAPHAKEWNEDDHPRDSNNQKRVKHGDGNGNGKDDDSNRYRPSNDTEGVPETKADSPWPNNEKDGVSQNSKFIDRYETVITDKTRFSNALPLRDLNEAWDNLIPDDIKSRISKIDLIEGKQTGGEFHFGLDSIDIELHLPEISRTQIPHILVHEVSHAIRYGWVASKILDFNNDVKDIPPLTEYAGRYKDIPPLESMILARGIVRALTKYANDEGIDHRQTDEYENLNILITKWGVSDDDIKSGKFQDMVDRYAASKSNQFAAEQFSEFMSILLGQDVGEYDKEAYERMKVLYETKYK